MLKTILLLSVSTLLVAGCRKDATTLPAPTPTTPDPIASPSEPGTTTRPKALYGDAHTGKGFSTEPDFMTYLIPAGQNFCVNNTYEVDTFYTMRFKAIFDSSCIYTSADPNNQFDINKLYGFSDASSHHHQNSARFGWNWEGGKLHIHAYCYRSGIRQSTELGTVSLNEPHEFTIKVRSGQYSFALDNKYFALMERGSNESYAHGYKLLPYFGGDEAAPHDVRIQIREMK